MNTKKMQTRDTPPSKGVRRCLFGPVNGEENRQLLREMHKALDAKDTRRWNFDFSTESPLPGRYQWEKVDTPSSENLENSPRICISEMVEVRRRKLAKSFSFVPISADTSCRGDELLSTPCQVSRTSPETLISEECHQRLHEGYRTPSPVDMGTPLYRRNTHTEVEPSTPVLDFFPIFTKHRTSESVSSSTAVLLQVPSTSVSVSRKRKQPKISEYFPLKKSRVLSAVSSSKLDRQAS